MMKRDNKRGLSTIVATLIIILVTLISAGLAWVVVKNVILDNKEEINLGKLTLNLEVENVQAICDNSNNYLILTVRRNAGDGEFTGLNFIVEDGENSETFTEYVSMNELEKRTFTFELSEIKPENIEKIKIIPIFVLGSGKETLGNINGEYSPTSNSGVSCSSNLAEIPFVDYKNCSLAPVALDATGVTNTSFIANWNAVSIADGYYLDVAKDSGFTNLIIDNLDVGNVTNYQVTGLDSGIIHYYRVRTHESICMNNNSNIIAATTGYNEIEYGLLYNWYAATDLRGLCPEGWHVPTNTEIDTLRTFIGSYVGGKLKETGFTYWRSPNTGATDIYNFSAYGSGYKGIVNPPLVYAFFNLNQSFQGWINGSYNTYNYVHFALSYNSDSFTRYAEREEMYRNQAFSVRCIRDTSVGWSSGELVEDIDNNHYGTVQIGTQIWLNQSLAVTHYSKGGLIPEVTDSESWTALTTGALCAYRNNWSYVYQGDWNNVYQGSCNLQTPLTFSATSLTESGFVANWEATPAAGYYLYVATSDSFGDMIINKLDVGNVNSYQVTEVAGTYYYRVRAYNGTCIGGYSNTINATTLYNGVKYGLLYNFYAANETRNISNTGWHVPTETEINALITYLGGVQIFGGEYSPTGGYLKETGFTHWNRPNTGATNSGEFSAIGSGYRYNGDYRGLNIDGYYFGLRASNTAFLFYCRYNKDYVTIGIPGVNNLGMAIRLIKNSPCSVNGQTGTYNGNDGKVYRTICIGTQEWLADNLAETKYRNGDIIPEVTDNAAWAGLTTGALCAYNNDWNYV